ncbi:MAG: HAD family hydrolase [Spirochaetaceae bacterium]|nr:MAG: HAD family hydrolase [Spirochaetaceae bacterium]
MSAPLLVFDLDGTLFRSEDVFVPAISCTLERYGLPVPPRGEILSFLTMTSTEFTRRITAGTSVSPEEFQHEFRLRERAAIPKDGRLYPGISEMLRNLRDDGFLMAICSNGSAKYVDIVLDALGIRSLFERCATNDRNVAKAELLRELLSDERPAVMVGDSPGDQAAAVACGVPFVYAAYGYGEVAPEQADDVCEAPEYLETVVRRGAFRLYTQRHRRYIRVNDL